MPVVTMKELLEAGVHFGHQTRRWDPKMREYIYTARNDIHVIDLQKTTKLIDDAFNFVKERVCQGARVLFVGTKKQAQETIAEEAKRCGAFYVNQRWLGGTLTNFRTIRRSIGTMEKIEKMMMDGTLEALPRKEVSHLKKEHAKLLKNLEGIRGMSAMPEIVFIVDSKKEEIAVREARRMKIPIVAVVDTNCDPTLVEYPVPANDDAIRAIKLLVKIMAEAVLAGKAAQLPAQPAVAAVEAVPQIVAAETGVEERPVAAMPEPLEAAYPKEIEEEIQIDLGESGLV